MTQEVNGMDRVCKRKKKDTQPFTDIHRFYQIDPSSTFAYFPRIE
jgi:hypothetical protein